jgi:ribosomal protein S18 acetylase RimI-like enzyme
MTGSPDIRPALPGDLDAVLRIGATSFAHDADRFGATWLVRRLARPGTELFVDSPGAGIVRGFLLVERYATGTVVKLVATDPQFRQQGVARRLLATVRGPAATWIRTENAPSRATFEAGGWVQTAPPKARSGEWTFYTLPPEK